MGICRKGFQAASHGGVQLAQHLQAPALGALAEQLLGYSVSRILEAAGHDVVKVQIINDRGIHICKSMVAWQRFGNGENPSIDWRKGRQARGPLLRGVRQGVQSGGG